MCDNRNYYRPILRIIGRNYYLIRKEHTITGKGGGSGSSSETERLQVEERRKRAQKERGDKERADNLSLLFPATQKEQADKERAEQKQADTERAEKERVANLPHMSVNFISPLPAIKLEFDVEETAEGALETVAPHYGLEKSDAPLLQLQFSETILTPKQQLTAEGMCDESQCHVLGVEAALETGKANILRAQSMDIVDAATFDRMEDVRLVCRYAPEKVNNTDDVSCCYTSTLLVLTLLLWGGTEWEHSSVQGCTQELSGDGTTPFGK